MSSTAEKWCHSTDVSVIIMMAIRVIKTPTMVKVNVAARFGPTDRRVVDVRRRGGGGVRKLPRFVWKDPAKSTSTELLQSIRYAPYIYRLCYTAFDVFYRYLSR